MNAHEYMRRWMLTEGLSKESRDITFAYGVYWALQRIEFTLRKWSVLADQRYTSEAKLFESFVNRSFVCSANEVDAGIRASPLSSAYG